MATSQSQRIGIWIIAVVLAIGTIGSFFVAILANNNAQIDQNAQKQKQEQYNKEYTEYQAKVDAQASELSKKYYSQFSEYVTEVGKFNADDVTSLKTKDLKVGDGKEIKKDTEYSAYYIGWNTEGKIFDSSIDGSKLKSPIRGTGLIKGWMDGVIGMKMGGVRLLTIPSDEAYGSGGSGDLIKPDMPIKFVVMVIPSPPEIPTPDFTKLMQ